MTTLLFAEDPGAANYLVAFVEPLKKAGCHVELVARGAAVGQFARWGVEAVYMPQDISAFLDDVSPVLVFVGTSDNPDTVAHRIVDEARRRRIPVFGVVDSVSSAHLRFRGMSSDPLRHLPDWILVPDEETRVQYEQLGVPSSQIRICGFPQYSLALSRLPELRSKGRENIRTEIFPSRLRQSYMILFVADAPFREDNEHGLSENFDGWGGTRERCRVALEEVIDACSALVPKPSLIVRPHPRDAADAFSPYASHVALIDRTSHPLDAVFAADLVVGLTACLLFEACIIGMRTLSVLVADGERKLIPPPLRQRLVTVRDRDGLQEALSKAVAASSKPHAAEAPLDPMLLPLQPLVVEMVRRGKLGLYQR